MNEETQRTESETRPEIRLYVVDDDTYARLGLTAMIDAEPDMRLVGQAPNGKAGLAGILDTTPDIALVDLHMPGMDGTDLILALSLHDIPTKTVVLTAHRAEADLLRAVSYGAAGYLLKGDPVNLFPSLRTVAQGGAPIDPALNSHLLSRLADNAHELLTTRELEILEASKAGASHDDVAAALHVAPTTVSKHWQSIYAKLQVNNKAAAIWKALKIGVIRRPLP